MLSTILDRQRPPRGRPGRPDRWRLKCNDFADQRRLSTLKARSTALAVGAADDVARDDVVCRCCLRVFQVDVAPTPVILQSL